MSTCDCNQGRLPCTCKTQLTGEYHADLNAAQSELAALREELASVRAIAGEVAVNSKRARGEFKESRDILEQRLAAAEQRNAALLELLRRLPAEFKAMSGGENTDGVTACIDHVNEYLDALTKPTESGASE